MFFDGWLGLLRTGVVGVLAYTALVALLRLCGKRTLSKLNAFDLVVTVALGSTLATVLLNKDVSLAEGIVAFAVLVGLQFAVTWTSVRVPWVRRAVTGEPQMLLYRGRVLRSALRKTRVSEDEVRSAIRASGWCDLADVEAVVLETDGSISVARRNGPVVDSSLAHVRGPTRASTDGSRPALRESERTI